MKAKTTDHKIIEQLELDKFIIYILDDKIIKIVTKEHTEIEVEDILKLQEAKYKLIGDKKHCVLFIPPRSGVMSKEARETASGEIANKNALAKAVVFKNLGMRIFINFFIRVNKPIVEHKIFENENDALEWLYTMYDLKVK